MSKTYYEILNVSQTASLQQIKAAYYLLAKKYHPDINPSGTEIFKEINTAYEILSKEDSREEYDEELSYLHKKSTKDIVVNNHKYNKEYDMSLSDFCELVAAHPGEFLHGQMGEELQKRFREVFPQFADNIIKPYTSTSNTTYIKSKSEKLAEAIGMIIGFGIGFWIIFAMAYL